MSPNEKQIADFGYTHQGSQNAGNWYSANNQPSPGQQPSEPHASYATRLDAYKAAEAKKSSGS